jgi:Fic family protein
MEPLVHQSSATRLREFVTESNRIEGITRPPMQREIDAHAAFLSLQTVTVQDLESFVDHVAGAELRRSPYMNVRVGNYFPPQGGPHIEEQLDELVDYANRGDTSPYTIHARYESLHPFMDGNGRSGRALWAWQMLQGGEDPFALPFLHRWYYQSLTGSRS